MSRAGTSPLNDIMDCVRALNFSSDRGFLLQVEREMHNLVESPRQVMHLPEMSSHYRRLAHIVAQRFRLQSSSIDAWGVDKRIRLCCDEKTSRIPALLLSDFISPSGSHGIPTAFQYKPSPEVGGAAEAAIALRRKDEQHRRRQTRAVRQDRRVANPKERSRKRGRGHFHASETNPQLGGPTAEGTDGSDQRNSISVPRAVIGRCANSTGDLNAGLQEGPPRRGCKDSAAPPPVEHPPRAGTAVGNVAMAVDAPQVPATERPLEQGEQGRSSVPVASEILQTCVSSDAALSTKLEVSETESVVGDYTRFTAQSRRQQNHRQQDDRKAYESVSPVEGCEVTIAPSEAGNEHNSLHPAVSRPLLRSHLSHAAQHRSWSLRRGGSGTLTLQWRGAQGVSIVLLPTSDRKRGGLLAASEVSPPSNNVEQAMCEADQFLGVKRQHAQLDARHVTAVEICVQVPFDTSPINSVSRDDSRRRDGRSRAQPPEGEATNNASFSAVVAHLEDGERRVLAFERHEPLATSTKDRSHGRHGRGGCGSRGAWVSLNGAGGVALGDGTMLFEREILRATVGSVDDETWRLVHDARNVLFCSGGLGRTANAAGVELRAIHIGGSLALPVADTAHLVQLVGTNSEALERSVAETDAGAQVRSAPPSSQKAYIVVCSSAEHAQTLMSRCHPWPWKDQSSATVSEIINSMDCGELAMPAEQEIAAFARPLLDAVASYDGELVGFPPPAVRRSLKMAPSVQRMINSVLR